MVCLLGKWSARVLAGRRRATHLPARTRALRLIFIVSGRRVATCQTPLSKFLRPVRRTSESVPRAVASESLSIKSFVKAPLATARGTDFPSLVPECDHRINLRRPPRRNPAREQGDQQ